MYAKSGFTLLEVLFAIGLVAMALTPIIWLQIGTVRATNTRVRRCNGLFLAKEFLFMARQKRPDGDLTFLLDDRDKETDTKLSYQADPPAQPELKSLPGLYRERVTASWKNKGVSKQIVLLTFRFDPRYKKAA